MPDENPYRYEGTAESLASPSEPMREVRPPSGNSLFFAGLFAAFAAAVLIPMFDLDNPIPASLCLLPFVLLPIGMYIGSFATKRDRLKAQFGFWIAALPLALYFVGTQIQQGFGAAMTRDIGRYLLLDYGSQLFAAAATMGVMTCRVPRPN